MSANRATTVAENRSSDLLGTKGTGRRDPGSEDFGTYRRGGISDRMASGGGPATVLWIRPEKGAQQ